MTSFSIFVLVAPLFATFITAYFKTSFLVSIFLYFIVPSIYLTIRDPKFVKKTCIVLLASLPFTIIVDYFAIRDGSWLNSTTFPFRVLNGYALEDFVWVAAWFYYTVSFYEYFIDQPRNVKDTPINKRYKTFLTGWFGALGIFGALYVFVEKYLYIPYFYLIFTMSFGIFPLAMLTFKRPQFLFKFLPAAVYFFFVSFLHEWSAFIANQWEFPGNKFIGWIILIGGLKFPIEEFIMWMMLGSVFVLTYYEYCIDDAK